MTEQDSAVRLNEHDWVTVYKPSYEALLAELHVTREVIADIESEFDRLEEACVDVPSKKYFRKLIAGIKNGEDDEI